MKVKDSTVFRVAMLVLALLNQVVAVIAETPVTSSLPYQIISIVVTIGVSILCMWKNNDFTEFAKLSGRILEMLKDGSVSIDEIKNLIGDKQNEKNS